MDPGPATPQAPSAVATAERRLRRSSKAANVAGGLVVFLLLAFALPLPRHLEHDWWLLGLNAGLLAASAVVLMPLADRRLHGIWRRRTAWVREGRPPTPQERDLLLRYPLTAHRVIGIDWVLGAVLFGVGNAFASLRLGVEVAITVLLGGVVMVALGYLLFDRLLRPVWAHALAAGVPARPQLPGVSARTVLSWLLGTGVLLLAMLLVAADALVHSDVSRGHLAWAIIALAIVGLVVGALLMLALARSLADPIEGLRDAVARVARGELDQDVPVDDGSEIGLLQAGFNQMLAGLRERERIRDLFDRQVGAHVVRHALEHGVELGGQAVEAAVLFVDLKGSTELAEERDPAEVVALLNAFFAIVVEVIDAAGGWVNKFEGDAALCVFGAPVSDTACAGRALAAARELSERLQVRPARAARRHRRVGRTRGGRAPGGGAPVRVHGDR